MANFSQPIGILGGTFDPVHFGHLRAAIELRRELQLREVRLIPCGVPPHRGPPSASGAHRLRMLELAVADEPGLVVDDREIKRSGPSYMVDTLTSLRDEFPDTPLCLVLGRDAYLGLPSWHRWQALFDLTHIVVLSRPGSYALPPPALVDFVASRAIIDPVLLGESLAGCVLSWSVPQFDISSTDIRRQFREKLSVRYLLPDVLIDYISAQGLYRS